MQANSRLSGHIVNSHVGGVSEVLSISAVDRYPERLMLGDQAAHHSNNTDKKDISMAFLVENGHLK